MLNRCSTISLRDLVYAERPGELDESGFQTSHPSLEVRKGFDVSFYRLFLENVREETRGVWGLGHTIDRRAYNELTQLSRRTLRKILMS